MAMNRIPFQPRLSMPEFFARFGTEEQCESALVATRWPGGFRCLRCNGSAHCILRVRSRPVYQCCGFRRSRPGIPGHAGRG